MSVSFSDGERTTTLTACGDSETIIISQKYPGDETPEEIYISRGELKAMYESLVSLIPTPLIVLPSAM